MWFMQNALKKPDNAGAGRHRLHAPASASWRSATCGCRWSRPRARKSRPARTVRASGLNAKLVTGRFFMERMLPETASHLKRIQTGADSMMELPAEAF